VYFNYLKKLNDVMLDLFLLAHYKTFYGANI